MTHFCSFSTVRMISVLGILFLATPGPTVAVTGIVPIDGTLLFTDTWYTIDLKSNKGRLAWAHAEIKTSVRHLQLANEANKDYHPGGRYWKDGHWKFHKTSDDANTTSLLMINEDIPNSWITFAGGDVEHAFVGLQKTSRDPDYMEELKFRNKVLWRIAPQQNDTECEYYSIFQEWFREDGLMFYEKPTNGRMFVQVYRNRTEPTVNDNSLWKFTPLQAYPAPTPIPTKTTSTTTTTVTTTQKPGGLGEDDSAVNIWLSQGLLNLCLLLVVVCV